MDFTPKPITQVPVTWNWDMTRVIGKATVNESGEVFIELLPGATPKPLYEMIRDRAIRMFSVSTEIDMNRAVPADLQWHLHKDAVVSGYDLAGDLKSRVEEWQPVRDFIAREFKKGIIKPMENYQEKARRLVFEYIKSKLEKTDKHVTFAQDEVYVVWFSKILQNWKCLISTTLPDGMYYEVTYNGDQHETYIDAYKKFDNVCIKDPDVGVHIPMVDSD